MHVQARFEDVPRARGGAAAGVGAKRAGAGGLNGARGIARLLWARFAVGVFMS